MTKLNRLADVARAAARLSPDWPQLGAVLVRGSRVISVGYNQRHKTHPKAATWTQSIHAEHSALLGVDAQGADLLVYRALRNGATALAKPCPDCWRLLRRAGVRRVYYTTPTGIAMERA